ncbi:MAG TPA: PAS domain S-box protein [Gemmatimonadales bacterium]|nr:PAS domain S-box protein [Gemmatimonadales bacterium]
MRDPPAKDPPTPLLGDDGFLRRVIDTDPNLIFVKDRAGRFVLANAAVAAVYATTPEHLVGRTDRDFNPAPDEVARFLRDDLEVMDTRGPKLVLAEPVTNPATGEVRWFQTVKVPLLGVDGSCDLVLGVGTDITARQRAEQSLRVAEAELQASRRRVEAILGSSLDALVTMDEEGLITGWSGQAEILFGWPEAEIVGTPLAETIVPHRHREAHRRGMAHFKRTGEGPILGHRIEITALRRNGEEFPVELTVIPMRPDRGCEFCAFIRDITERRRAELRLGLQHAVTRTLSEAATLADAASDVLRLLCEGLGWDLGEMWVVDPADGLIRQVGGWHGPAADLAEFAAASRSFTFARGEGTPGAVWDTGRPVWTPDIASDSSRSRGPAAARGRLRATFGSPMRSRRGVIGALQFFSRELREPDPDLLDMMESLGSQIGQVVERARAEEAIRASENRYRLLMEQAGDAILVLDTTGSIVDANTAATELTGYSRAELLALTLADTYPPEDREMALVRMRQVSEGEAVRLERQLRRKNGENVDVEISAKVLPGGLMQGIIRDIRERRTLEEQLRQSQKMEAVGKLAGGVAHDFNNLLTAIAGYAELVLDTLASEDPRRLDVQEICQATDRAATLTRQLLAFSRRQVLQPRLLDLHNLVMGVERLVRRLIGEDVEIVSLTEPGLGLVRADPSQLEQVLLNLAVNARDAMPGGGRLTIETRNALLGPEYTAGHAAVEPGPYVLLAVTDNGSGMDDATRTRIFEPFFTTKEPGRGTGLGLSMVYGIVKQSGGYIWVYSEVGRGTSFKIYLPRVAGEVAQAAPEPAPSGQGGKETILLVEDEPAVRSLAHRLLTERGYRVIAAADGTAALDLAGRHEGVIDLLMTDVVMPGMGGRELAERLLALRPATRVLYITGYTEDTVVRHGLVRSGLSFLEKPFRPDVLLARVRQVLD